MVVFGQKLLYSGKVVVFRQTGCIWANVVVFGKVFVFGQSGCIRSKWLYLGKSG